jgi:DNA-binding IclR family transcriptional regulator
MTVLSMSRTEIDRLHVLRDVIGERISAREAAQLMRMTPRQVFRLLKGLRAEGTASLTSKRRGRTSNNKLPSAS